MTPFNILLSEQDQDYEYTLYSVENIHDSRLQTNLQLALGRYGLISIISQGVKPSISAKPINTIFPNAPFSVVYASKLIMANPISSNAVIQSVALFTRIPAINLKIVDKDGEEVADGADAEQHAFPVEVPSDEAQQEVGNLRVDHLISDLMTQIIVKREVQDKNAKKIYSGYITEHKTIAKILGKRVAAGLYMYEAYIDYAKISGPFKKCPINYPYMTKLPSVVLHEEIHNKKKTNYILHYTHNNSK